MKRSRLHEIKTTGFTLVEMIVVIVILAILATIAFLSFGSYSASARDSKRMSNVNIMAQGIEMNLSTDRWIVLSEFSTGNNLVLKGSGLSLTGIYADKLGPRFLSSINVSGDSILNDDFQTYHFSFIPKYKYFQVEALLEKQQGASFMIPEFNAEEAIADSGSVGYVYIKGNYTMTGGILSLIPTSDAWTTASGTTDSIGNTYKSISGTGSDVLVMDASAGAFGSSSGGGSGGGGGTSVCTFDSSTFDNCTFQ